MSFKTSKMFILLGFLAMQLFAASIPMKWIGSFSQTPKSAKNGDAYHNTTNGKSYVMDNNAWNILSEGSVGPRGPQGIKGDKGDQGIQGLTGATGPQGPIGLTGPQGAAGQQGDQGVQGEKGDIGPSGPQGPRGNPGSGTTGVNPGDMQYWDGTQWVIVPVGRPGQVFTLSASNVPVWATLNSNTNPENTITDIEGNVYHVVTIGTQTWMVENLKTTRFNNGVSIQLVTDNAAWGALTTPGFCYYNNGTATTPYGALYNRYAVNTGKLAPTGWHVATDAEWTTLTNYLGGVSVAGGKLKEAGLAHWLAPNTGATNETGFSALPGGYRDDNGRFWAMGSYGFWWSSTEYDATSSLNRQICSGDATVYRNYGTTYGFSVRCVRD